ncbi:uncharacterized protein ISCGN_006213 [Ixodes scapularis]
MPPRVQRFFLRLLKYDYTLIFVPGKQMALADMLSRSPAPGNKGAADTGDVEIHAVTVVSALVSEKTAAKLAHETATDPYLSVVLRKLGRGDEVEGALKSVAAELSVVDGILLKGTKVVIPTSMRREMLKRIHAGHLGTVKCKARARQLVYWPNINSDIESLIQSCPTCRTYAYKQPSEPLILQPTPTQPWYRVGVDLFQYSGRHYLCVYDSMSNFPEVELLPDTTATSVIDRLSAIFSRYGIPTEVCSDNGPQFSSHEFALFAKHYDFKHVKSSPQYPQSNGLAEKGVQIIKRILKKMKAANECFWLGILNYRACPVEDGRSPGELLQGRRLRTPVPDFDPLPAIRVKKHRQTGHNERVLPRLKNDDVVRLNGASWARKSKVVGSAGPRSFYVRTENNTVLRRNRRHLLATKEECEVDLSDDKDSDNDRASSHGMTSTAPTITTALQTATTTTLQAAAQQPTVQPPRRTTRQKRPPERLGYDERFQQTSQRC